VLRRPIQPPPPIPEVLREADQPTQQLGAVGTRPLPEVSQAPDSAQVAAEGPTQELWPIEQQVAEQPTDRLRRVEEAEAADEEEVPTEIIDLSIIPGFMDDDADDDADDDERGP
jgi:hypothetical protein